jgi:hypothetical protein
VLVIRFNRPEKKNAITQAMYARMTEGLLEAEDDAGVRAVAFLGTEGCFSAGNDMADFLAFAMASAVSEPAASVPQGLWSCRSPSSPASTVLPSASARRSDARSTVPDRSLFKTPFVDLALVRSRLQLTPKMMAISALHAGRQRGPPSRRGPPI